MKDSCIKEFGGNLKTNERERTTCNLNKERRKHK